MKTIHVNPSISVIKLSMSCTVTSDYLTLLPYCHSESKADIQDQIVHGLSLYIGYKFKILEPCLTNVQNFTKTDIRNELKDTKESPVKHLLMTFYKLKGTDEDKHSFCLIWLLLRHW